MVVSVGVDETRIGRNRSLPAGWRIVRFGDVVRNVKVDVNPDTSGLERYVAGEHMDSDDLHIWRWGTIGDGYLGPAFHRKFARGQVLYGSRRTYLRKIAVAEFDGICANTTFVLEPASGDLLPELLPFIMQTVPFTAHSVKQSKGSVNPYINWRDIAWYEFALPPKDEQRRIAEILWAVDRTVQRWLRVLEHLEDVRQGAMATKIHRPISSDFAGRNGLNEVQDQSPSVPLEELLTSVQYGSSAPSSARTANSVPILRIPNVVNGALDLSDLKWVTVGMGERERYAIRQGDILLVRTNGNPEYVGRCTVVQKPPEKAIYASYLIRLRVRRELVYPEYVGALINSDFLRKSLRHEIRSSAGNYNINTGGLKRQRIPIPPLNEQLNWLARVGAVDAARDLGLQHNDHLRQLGRNLRQLLLVPNKAIQSV